MKKGLKKGKDKAVRFRRLPVTLVIAAVVLAAGALTVISKQMGASTAETKDQAASASTASPANKHYVTVHVAGRDVQVDSQTGQVRELTQEEKEKLAAGLHELINNTDEGLVPVHHPDGSVSVDLQGHYQNVAVARINDDGSLTEGCVDNAQAAGEFFGIDPQMIENQPGKGSSTKQRTPVTPVRNQ